VRDGFFPAPDFDGQAHEPGAGTWLNPGVVFSPVADTLFVAHADEDRLTRVDFGAQEVTSMEVRPRLGLLERLLSLGASIAHAKMLDGTTKSAAISADGETLYIAGVDSQVTNKETGRFELVQRPLGLQVVEAASGTELSSLDTQAAQVSVLPDGLVLLLSTAGDAPLTEVYDPATQGIATRYDGLYQECLPLAGGGYVLAPALFYYELGVPSVAIYDERSTEPLATWELSHRESQWVQGCAP
jgi:hypothetical protein